MYDNHFLIFLNGMTYSTLEQLWCLSLVKCWTIYWNCRNHKTRRCWATSLISCWII